MSLFDEGAAVKMPPLEAFSLFSDYRDLAPLGEQGDGMIRRLSERLLTAGLPDRAAGLLEHQVRYRLTGTPQAVVAIRAALVDLMAHQPRQAVAILRLTRQNDLPPDVVQKRNLVEARALIELGQLASALDLLEDDRSQLAVYLKLDAHWRSKNWPALRAVAASLYTVPPKTLTDETQKQLVRWAFAVAMDGAVGERELLRRRYNTAMSASRYQVAFGLLTSAGQIGTAQTKRLAATLADIDGLQDMSGVYPAQEKKAQARAAAVAPEKFAAN
jgi:hypothetical protein